MAFDPRSGPVSKTITGLATVAEIQVRQQEVLWVAFAVGVAALTAFDVAIRLTPTGTYFTLATAAVDYTAPAPNSIVMGASGDLTTSGAAATIRWIKLDVKAVETVRIQAAGTASTITGWFQAQ